MFDFLGRGRSKSASDSPVVRQATHHRTPPPAASATQREMVRLTLHNVLRQRGIPGNWLTCEITPIQIAGRGDAVLVQLVVLKWHDALMPYAPALQQGILEGLKHFDANATASKYHFSWAFAPDCGCPHTKFPEPSVWNTGAAPTPIATIQAIGPAAAVGASTTASPSKPKFDLPPTAADMRNTNDDDDDHGFAATQINDI